MNSLEQIKQRFQIVGNDPILNRCLEKAVRVASTDISVLITGESGVGKEVLPKIIHQNSHRKHASYIAVNCGAIPEGTIDSELFGHEKGSFTGATQTRKGYFEVADGGTIFLDEVGELPLTTQVRLLRVLENKEFMRVGASAVQKTNVRIVAATNVKILKAIQKGKFREDLYYRLSTIEINLPALRDRSQDIYLLFRKFAMDFANKYKMPTIRLQDNAIPLLLNYHFPGNIRQLRNIAEQISIIEERREISAECLKKYLPQNHNLPALVDIQKNTNQYDSFAKERDLMYKAFFDMRNELNDLKQLTLDLLKEGNHQQIIRKHERLIEKINNNTDEPISSIVTPSWETKTSEKQQEILSENGYDYAQTIEAEESLSLEQKEIEMIQKSLKKHRHKRKLAAKELGISERTLYRKIKQYDL